MSEKDTMSQETLTKPRIIELEPLGYGNPDATISFIQDNGESDSERQLSERLKEASAEIINSGECIVDITESDDGCIDGREAVFINYNDRGGVMRKVDIAPDYTRERAKIAGGGYITGLAMKLSLRPPRVQIDDSLRATVIMLSERDLHCGAHSGEHQASEATDCGANDKLEPIFENGLLFGDEIGKTTSALMEIAGAPYSADAQTRVREGWAHALQVPHFFEGSTGESRLETILDTIGKVHRVLDTDEPVSVSKHLSGKHNEKFIIVNYLDNKTFSQSQFRQKMLAQFPDVPKIKIPQAFVVDVPRIITLANRLASNSDENQVAIQAGVAYQLATASTLTDGSLRIFAIK